jgi:putative DNA primase/helicase
MSEKGVFSMSDTNQTRPAGQGPNDKLPCQAALAYAKAGLLVFPSPRGSKMSYKSARFSGGARWGATKDPDQIRADWARWPQANVCIVTGIDSGIFVVEIDTPKGHGVDGFKTLERLEASHGPMPVTLQAESPSGSRHFYFLMPKSFVVRNDTGTKLGPGIDIRGEGGMVIAPPSVRDDGAYVWLNDAQIEKAPGWILTRLIERARPARVSNANADKVPQTLVEMLLETIDPDAPYSVWFAIGCAIYTTLGDEVGEQVFDQWSKRGRKYKPRQMESMWRSIVNCEGYNYTIGTLNHFADLAAVDRKLEADLERINREALDKDYFEVTNDKCKRISG